MISMRMVMAGRFYTSPDRVDQPARPHPAVTTYQGRSLGPRRRRDEAISRVAGKVVGDMGRHRGNGRRDLLHDHVAAIDEGPKPGFGRALRHDTATSDEHRNLPQRDRSNGQPPTAHRLADGACCGSREAPRLEAQPQPRMRVEDDQRAVRRARDGARRRGRRALPVASHAAAAITGFSMSPTMRAVPAIQPKTSVAGPSGGTSLATARPFFVITTGVRYFFTSSMTRRHRALNSPAGMVFMAASIGSWSSRRDHVTPRAAAGHVLQHGGHFD